MDQIQVTVGHEKTIDFELDVEGLRDTEITEARLIVKGKPFDKMFTCSKKNNTHFSVSFYVEELSTGCIEVIAGNYFFEAMKFKMIAAKEAPKATVKAKVDNSKTDQKTKQPEKQVNEETIKPVEDKKQVNEKTIKTPAEDEKPHTTNEKIAEVLESLGLGKRKTPRKLIDIKR